MTPHDIMLYSQISGLVSRHLRRFLLQCVGTNGDPQPGTTHTDCYTALNGMLPSNPLRRAQATSRKREECKSGRAGDNGGHEENKASKATRAKLIRTHKTGAASTGLRGWHQALCTYIIM